MIFVKSMVKNYSVRMPTFVTSLATSGHGIFLAALILASKNLNDTSPRNKHAETSLTQNDDTQFGISTAEVNVIGRQLIDLLDMKVRIRLGDLQSLVEPLLAALRSQYFLVASQSEPKIDPSQARDTLLPLDAYTKASNHSIQHKIKKRRLRRGRNLSRMALQMTVKMLKTRAVK
jgi:hypothetical protein